MFSIFLFVKKSYKYSYFKGFLKKARRVFEYEKIRCSYYKIKKKPQHIHEEVLIRYLKC
tara:strand:+ start:435 stop:611 length:177 start_codon:yes stop_codon:yes gene_type:complete